MRSVRARALVAALTTAALLTAGCGQKPGVAEMAVGVPGAGAGGVDAGTAAGDGLAGAPGTVAGGGSGAAGAAGGSAPGTTGDGAAAGTAGGAGAAGGGGGSTAPGAPTAPKGGGDTTGVTDSTIKIGVHAPVTGAAAFPQQSFERGIGVYADYINRKGGIHGRKINYKMADDQYEPARTATVKVRVRSGEAVSRSYSLKGEPVAPEHGDAFPTIDGLFDEIARALDRGADVELAIQPEFGFPMEATIVYRPGGTPDDVAFDVVKLLPAGPEGPVDP